MELCLYDARGEREIARLPVPGRSGDIWHAFAPGAGPEHSYGYRVHGPYAPWLGHRFNANKLLLDPYAHELTGTFRWDHSHLGYRDEIHLEEPSDSDNAACMVKARIAPELAPAFPGPGHRLAETVLYELHLKGFTQCHPAVPESERGSVAALGSDAIIDYLKALGVTAVELLPVHAFIDEPFLRERGLSNYWGYNTLAYFAVHMPYLAGAGPGAFQRMVQKLHDAGLEVILDVVYNHSCEGSELGPTLSFRGIDNSSYYRLDPSDPGRYVNDTGCGNTLATQHPAVRRLTLDSLRYWAGTMGIDGFRFDLAPVLGRGDHGFDPHSALLKQIASDPQLSRCKLIAEPWDIGAGGYRLGGFPSPWAEWNDRYRDSVRRFWRGDDGELPELARRLHGSGEIYEEAGREPWASINFVTSHDGFTLSDLVSFARRHNLANGEDNRDGHSENYSDNCGVEGASHDPTVNARRGQQQRNLLATLVLSQGVPMLQAGDELGRSQRGNNNAYCQDNALSWIDWSGADEALQQFTRALLSLRRRTPLLWADRFRHADPDADGQTLSWLAPEGGGPDVDYWHEPENRAIGCLLEAAASREQHAAVLILLNAADEAVSFSLPEAQAPWQLHIDTALLPWTFDHQNCEEDRVRLEGHSLQLLTTGPALMQSPAADPSISGEPS